MKFGGLFSPLVSNSISLNQANESTETTCNNSITSTSTPVNLYSFHQNVRAHRDFEDNSFKNGFILFIAIT